MCAWNPSSRPEDRGPDIEGHLWLHSGSRQTWVTYNPVEGGWLWNRGEQVGEGLALPGTEAMVPGRTGWGGKTPKVKSLWVMGRDVGTKGSLTV